MSEAPAPILLLEPLRILRAAARGRFSGDMRLLLAGWQLREIVATRRRIFSAAYPKPGSLP